MRAPPMWLMILTAGLCVMTGGSTAAEPRQQSERRSVSGLIFDLQHPETNRRVEAARLLGQNKVRTAVPALIEASDDPEVEVRYAIVKALVRIHDRRALHTYVRQTGDTDPEVQEKAIEGIINVYVGDDSGFIRGLQNVVDFVNPFSDDYNALVVEPFIDVDGDAVTALAAQVLSDRQHIRKDAAIALGILRARSALPALEDALGRETSNDVKVELIRTLYKIGDPSVGEALIQRMLDTDKRVHDEAIFTVGRLRISEAVPSLIDMLRTGVEERRKIFGFVPVSGSDDLSRRVFQALAHIGDPRGEQIFLESLDANQDWSRQYAAEGLGRIGDTTHLRVIVDQYLREDSGRVRLALGYARYRLGQAEYLAEVVALAHDSDQAYAYLMEFDAADVSRLYPYLRSEPDEITITLLEVVGMRGDRSAIAIAEDIIRTGNADVRAAANLAILRLRGRYPDA